MARKTVGDNCLLIEECWEEAFFLSIFKFIGSESQLLAIRGRGLRKAFSSRSQHPKTLNWFRSLIVVGPCVTRFTWLEKKKHGVQGRKGIYFGKTWAQVAATLWGKRNLESSYLENSFQRVAKSYPKVFCFPFWPLADFGCPLLCDWQPNYFTN